MAPTERPTFERPAFRPGMVPGVVDPDQVFLLTETRQYILLGRGYRAVAPLLDGTRSMGRVVEEAGASVPLPEAMYAVEQLIRKGYVIDAAGSDADPGRAAWWDALGSGAAAAERGHAGRPVALRAVGGAEGGDGGDGAAAVVAALEAAGLSVDVLPGDAADAADVADDAPAPSGGPSLSVVVTDDYLRPALADVDRRHRESGRSWMLAKPVGAVVWLGPVFVPGATACWHCLASRLRGNRQVERYLERAAGVEPPLVTTRAGAPVPGGVGAHLLATAVESWAVAGAPPEALVGVLRTQDLLAWETAFHEVTRRPQCPACGDPALRDPERVPDPPVLASRRKADSLEGGFRVERPETTWKRLERHVSPVTGVVSSLVRKEPADNDATFSFAAGHDFVHQGHDLEALRGNLRFRSGGKGRTELQARVSAVCEAVERWAGVWRADEPRIRGTAREVGERALPLDRILGFSEAQVADRHAWNRACSPTRYHVVPNPLDPGLEIDWSRVFPLSVLGALGGGEPRLVPSAWAWYGHPDARHFFCATDANGTSAGNALEEAVLQGFLELVERDAVAVWWYNRIPRPAVDLDSFRDPWVDRMREHHRSLGRELWVLDLTHDLGIPVFAGVSRRTDGPPEDIVTSFGAHLDPSVALTRAIAEVNQFLPALSRRRPDGTTDYAYDDPDAMRWWSEATVGSEPYLLPAAGTPTPRSAFRAPRHDDLRDDVQRCLAAAAGAGLDVYVLDQSRPDVDLRVVRVVVPGLRHFWRRLGPGRLYDVPVSLGWLDRARAEDEMNPVSMFF